jgi:O-antigen ligase
MNDFAELVLCISPLYIFHFSVANGRQRELRLLLMWILLCLSCTSVMTLMGELGTEEASRLLTGRFGSGNYTNDEAMLAMEGIAQRSQVYSIGLLVAPMLYSVRFISFRQKIIYLACAALFFYISYTTRYSSLMMGIFLGLILLSILLLGIRGKAVNIIGILLVIGVIIGTAQPKSFSFLARPILGLRDMTTIRTYQERIEAVVDTISGAGDSIATARTDLYWMSWKAFCSEPLFGVGIWPWGADMTSDQNQRAVQLGGHSVIFDILGSSGLFGFMFFVLLFVSFFKYLSTLSPNVLDRRWWPVASLFMFPFIMFLMVNNLTGYHVYMDFFLLMPGMAFVYRRPQDLGLVSSQMNRLPMKL